MTEYPFRFQTGSKKKGTCPECGHRDVWRYYEDHSGQRLDEQFGRCERVNSCGHFETPRGVKFEGKGSDYTPPPPPEIIQPNEFELRRISQTLGRFDSEFHKFCRSLGIPMSHLDRWKVGSDRNGMTVFVHADRQGVVVNAKWIRYKEGGKRGHEDGDEFSLKQPPVEQNQRYGFCLFGEHLLTSDKLRGVMLVESEKTAVIASHFYPQYDWLACGSCNGLTDAKIQALYGRVVYWLADADGGVEKKRRDNTPYLSEGGRANSSLRKLAQYTIRHAVLDLYPERTDGWDLADDLIAGVRPDLRGYVDNAVFVAKVKTGEGAAGVPGAGEGNPLSAKLKAEKKLRVDRVLDAVGIGGDANESPKSALSTKKRKKKKEAFSFDGEPLTVIYTPEGSMWVKGRGWEMVASNFQLFIKYQTEDEQEQITWILELRRASGESIFLEVPHEDFCSAQKLTNHVTGKTLALKLSAVQLAELRNYLFTQTKFSKAIKVLRYGYHAESGVFFFSNCAIVPGQAQPVEPDEFGIIQSGDLHLSMPTGEKKNKREFALTDHGVLFNEFFKVYAACHLYPNAFLACSWFLFSLFRDIAVRLKKNSPILFLKGGPSSGKSAMARVLTATSGVVRDGVNLKAKNTESALNKKMSQLANEVIWFDEYHPEFAYMNMLQAAYDNNGYHRSSDTSTARTNEVEIHSALVLSTNHMPHDDVFFSRVIFVPITQASDKTDAQVLAFNTLKTWEDRGLGRMTVELLSHRDLLTDEHYTRAYDRLYGGLKTALAGETKVLDRLFGSMAQMLTPAYLLHCAGEVEMLYGEWKTEDDVLRAFVEMGAANIRRQHRIMSEKTALAEFMEIIQTLYDARVVHEEIHFRMHGLDILLWFPQLYNLYAQRYRQVYMKAPADKESIKAELASVCGKGEWEEIEKPVRFRNDGEHESLAPTIPRKHSCSVPYALLVERYGLDLQSRKPQNP